MSIRFLRAPLAGTSVRARLLAINLLLLLAQGTVGAIAWHTVNAQKAAMGELALISKAARYHQDADAIRANLRADVYEALASTVQPSGKDAETTPLLSEHVSDLRKDLRTLEQLSLPADLADSLKNVEVMADVFIARASEAVDGLRDDSHATRHVPAFIAASDALGDAMDQQTLVLASRIVGANETADSAAATAKLSLVAASILTTVLVASLVAIVSASIRGSLRRVRDVAKDIAGGNLHVRSLETGRDEIGHLGVSINQMADSLSEVIGRLRADVERDSFNRQLGDALDAADTESAAHQVIARAMEIISPNLPTELLVSDSSRTHLERATKHPLAGAPGCDVESPYDCLAVRRGITQRFADSNALNACSHLQGRPCGRVASVCVPLSFMGRALGVLHAAAPFADAPTAIHIDQLTTLGTQAGARIGTVRAFERTQLQASTDSLTGLSNRRAANELLRALTKAGRAFSFVLCDLDHFKQLNDRHGHEAGDAALRLFSDVLRRAVREHDMAARWGGEEFVLILPESIAQAAADVVDRIQKALRAAVASASVPPFTSSFGVADSAMTASLRDLVRLTDLALYQAKDGGRDRCVVADPARGKEHYSRHPTERSAAIDAAMMDTGVHDLMASWPPRRALSGIEPGASANEEPVVPSVKGGK
jgi:diguanylate cyclase (GGDEF)-like protein